MKFGRTLRRWWWIAIPLGFILAWLSGILFDRAVKQRLERIGNNIAGKGYTFSIGHAAPDLFGGSIVLSGIELQYDTITMDQLQYGGINEILAFTADKVDLREVSYWDLLSDGEVRFHVIEVTDPHIQYYFRPAPAEDDLPADDVVEEKEVSKLPSLIRVDTLLIRSANGSTTDLTGTRPSFQIGRLDIIAYDLDLRTYETGLVSYRIGGADIHARDLSAELPPLYDIVVSDLYVDHPSGTAMLRSMRLDPRYDPKEYGSKVDHEQDLFEIQADTVQFIGIDVGRFLSEQVLHMQRMEVKSPLGKVYRDKTIADGPFNYKHLPVSGLRNFGVSLRIDTVTVSDGSIEYHEKDVNSPDYGMVSFSDIHGIMSGLNNSKDADTTSHLIVEARARIYERTPVKLHYKAAMASTHDAFILDAQLGALPFSVLNRMTDDLLNVKATEGNIHSMHIRMQGNEWQASGTLDLAYEDLRIDLVPKATKWHEGKLKNLIGNALVRRRNMPGRRNYRQGEFVVDRRKNRAIFNFIWQAVKIGSVNTMAPGIIRDQMEQAAKENKGKK